jgi:hypothetical protein
MIFHIVENGLNLKKDGHRTMAKVMNHTDYPKQLRTRSEDELRFIMQDAKEAIDAMPDGENVGYYADEICYCADELWRRRQLREAATIKKTAGSLLAVAKKSKDYTVELLNGNLGFQTASNFQQAGRGYVSCDVNGETSKFDKTTVLTIRD